MEFLIDYGSFLLKTISLIIIISLPFLILFSSRSKDSSQSGTLKITNLSDKLDNMAGAVNRSGVEYKSLLPYLKLDSSRDLLDGYFDEFLALGLSTR